MTKITRALISCTDKTGLIDLGKFLIKHNIEILSTGGTAKLFRDNGINATEVADFTGSPEILDGRLKTLHPKIAGGILGMRGSAKHRQEMAENGIKPIDLIIVNLYAFEKTIADKNCTLDHAIENIDIGGPTMLRAAAKNYKDVAVVVDPTDYATLMQEIESPQGLSEKFKFKLAVKVFQTTAYYDGVISRHLTSELNKLANGDLVKFPQNVSLPLVKSQDLRYGENPHQSAAFYKLSPDAGGLTNAKQLQGKELSFNNILDLDAAYGCCREFDEPACVIVKHLNPCGVAVAKTLSEAFYQARSADPVSSFGGIVALNRPVDDKTAVYLAETFFEVIIAPKFEPAAIALLEKKKNLRLMEYPAFGEMANAWDVRRVSGGLLIQESDTGKVDLKTCKVATKRGPTAKELADLNFAWKVVKHVKSNAIVYARDSRTLGVGAGQMSRVDSTKIGANKAIETHNDKNILKGTALASDAFFPFRDGIDVAASFGVTAIVQPGGSVRDEEVIAACDEHGIAMVFTGMRHFRH